MLNIHCKRHYRNLATHSWCTIWREHFTKTAPARRRHSVGGGGGGAPISYDRRRRRQQNVGGGGAAAAAHSFTAYSTWFNSREQIHSTFRRDQWKRRWKLGIWHAGLRSLGKIFEIYAWNNAIGGHLEHSVLKLDLLFAILTPITSVSSQKSWNILHRMLPLSDKCSPPVPTPLETCCSYSLLGSQ